MMDGDKMFIFHILYGDPMVIIGFFSLQRGKRDAAAADHSASCAVDDVAADRADIELAAQHIGGDVLVGDMLTVHQFNDGNSQCL